MLQDHCIKNELSLDEDDGPIPELVDDQESDDEETDSYASRYDFVPRFVKKYNDLWGSPVQRGTSRLPFLQTGEPTAECGIIRLPLTEPSVGNASRYDFVPLTVLEDFIPGVYLCSGKKYNDLWGAGQRGTSRLPSLQTGEPTAVRSGKRRRKSRSRSRRKRY